MAQSCGGTQELLRQATQILRLMLDSHARAVPTVGLALEHPQESNRTDIRGIERPGRTACYLARAKCARAPSLPRLVMTAHVINQSTIEGMEWSAVVEVPTACAYARNRSETLVRNGMPAMAAGLSPLHEHRHDHMDVVVHAHGTEHAGRAGAGDLQRHLPFQDTEHVLQVLAVEGDLGVLAINARI